MRAPPNILWRVLSRFFAIAPVTLLMMRLAAAVDLPLMRATRGRLRLSFVVPMLLLECRGARTGQPRIVPLVYAPDGERMILVASNGGRPRHPAWCFNLRAHPMVRCTLKGRIRGFVATELDGDERDAAWSLALDVYPGYASYQARSDRRIPLFRLEPL